MSMAEKHGLLTAKLFCILVCSVSAFHTPTDSPSEVSREADILDFDDDISAAVDEEADEEGDDEVEEDIEEASEDGEDESALLEQEDDEEVVDEVEEAVDEEEHDVEEASEDAEDDSALVEQDGGQFGRYDCDDGFENWKRGWSGAKMRWCCTRMAKGCPESKADRKRRAAAEASLKQTEAQEEKLRSMDGSIASKIKEVQQMDQVLRKHEAQLEGQTSEVQKLEKDLERLFEVVAHNRQQKEAATEKIVGKEKAIKMKEYDIKMKGDAIHDRLRKISKKVEDIVRKEAQLGEDKKLLNKNRASLMQLQHNLNKTVEEDKAHRAEQDLLIKEKLASFDKKKEMVYKRKKETDAALIAMRQREIHLKKQDAFVSEQDHENEATEQKLMAAEKKMRNELDEKNAIVTIEEKSLRLKTAQVDAEAKKVNQKQLFIKKKKKDIAKLEAQLRKLEAKTGEPVINVKRGTFSR